MKIHLTLSFSLLSLLLHAQQDPLYAQYLLNPVLINPSFAGVNDNLHAVASYRVQWAGFEGQPNTLSASIHSSFVDNRVGLGMVIIQDKIGNVSNTSANVLASYKLRLEGERVISFGMMAGLQGFKADNGELNIYDPTDQVFLNTERGTRFNIGAGALYKSNQLTLGLSVPRLLPTTFKNGGQEFQLYDQHYYLMASYLHLLSENLWLKPSVLARGVSGAPVSLDVAVNAILNTRYVVGGFTRNLNTYGLLLQMLLTDRFILGYTFEVPMNNSVGTKFTTHELNLGVRLSVFSFHDKTMNHF